MTTLTLTVDVDAPYGRVLLTSLQETSLLSLTPTIIAGDHYALRLQLARRQTLPILPAQPFAPPSGTTAVLSAKAPGASGPLLFYTDAIHAVLDDDDQPIPGLYQADLDLNTSELLAYVAAAPSGPKLLLMELELRDTPNTRRYSLQWDAIARPQVYAGEGTPTPAPPPYPAPSSILTVADLGQPDRCATLDASGKVPTTQLPTLALTAALGVADATARLALSASAARGKVVVQASDGTSWLLVSGGDPAVAADWVQVGDRAIAIGDVSGLADALDNRLKISHNLEDLEDVSVARDNLGLGTAAVEDVGAANGVAELDASGKVPLAQLRGPLEQIGGITSPTADDVIQYKSGSWVRRALAQLRDDLQALAWTLASNLVLNGTNSTAPNQTAASAASLMTRALVDSRQGAVRAALAANHNITNSATLTDVLSVSLEASTTYLVVAYWTEYVNTGTMGARRRLNWSAGSVVVNASAFFGIALNGQNWSTSTVAPRIINETTSHTPASETLYLFSFMGFFRSSSPGTLSLQCAQAVAESSTLVMGTGSHLTVIPIAR